MKGWGTPADTEPIHVEVQGPRGTEGTTHHEIQSGVGKPKQQNEGP